MRPRYARCRLKELTLPQSIALWGLTPLGLSPAEFDTYLDSHPSGLTSLNVSHSAFSPTLNCEVIIPHVSPKYLQYLRLRRVSMREYRHQSLMEHPGVITVKEVR